MIELGKNIRDVELPENYFDCLLANPSFYTNLDFYYKYNKDGTKKKVTTNTKKKLAKIRIWEKCIGALKPGAFGVVFVPRKYLHRVACDIEDAGFEIRDTIIWQYKARVLYAREDDPKMQSVLRATWEPILLIRKPFEFTNVKQNWDKWKVGKLNLHEARMYDLTYEKFDSKGRPKNKPLDTKSPSNLFRTHLFMDGRDNFIYYDRRPSLEFINLKFENRKTYVGNKRRQLVKPEIVYEYLLKIISWKGFKVLDPTSGFGALSIICEKHGRQYFGYEEHMKYKEIYDKYKIPYVINKK